MRKIVVVEKRVLIGERRSEKLVFVCVTAFEPRYPLCGKSRLAVKNAVLRLRFFVFGENGNDFFPPVRGADMRKAFARDVGGDERRHESGEKDKDGEQNIANSQRFF